MSQDNLAKYNKWQKVNPINEPKIPKSQLPKHEPQRFEEYTEIVEDSVLDQDQSDIVKVIGFKLKDGSQFIFDSKGGWTDEMGCYYNKDGQPEGWKLVNIQDKKAIEYFYDMFGQYVPTDLEENDDEIDDDDDDSSDEVQTIQNEIKQKQIDNDQNSLQNEVEEYILDDLVYQDESDEKEPSDEDNNSLQDEVQEYIIKKNGD